jgi:hypothetical protein
MAKLAAANSVVDNDSAEAILSAAAGGHGLNGGLGLMTSGPNGASVQAVVNGMVQESPTGSKHEDTLEHVQHPAPSMFQDISLHNLNDYHDDQDS